MGLKESDDLISRILSNDKQAIGEISLIIERIVRRWKWAANLDYEDVAQEVMTELIVGLKTGRFRGEAKVTTYVYAIARNICVEKYREDRLRECAEVDLGSLPDPGPTPEEVLVNKMKRKRACQVLLALPSECKKLWRSVFWGRKNYAQVAEMLGLTEGTVKRKMWECRQLAHQLLEKFEKEELY